MEGVAYRGRVLVEIGVIDSSLAQGKNIEKIKIKHINDSKVYIYMSSSS